MTRAVYYLPTVVSAAVIAVLSLQENPFLPDVMQTWSDKTLHALAYAGLAFCGMAGLYMDGRRRCRHYAWAWAASVAYGGLMEVLQATCTETRAADWLDVWADMAGAGAGIAVFYLCVRCIALIHR